MKRRPTNQRGQIIRTQDATLQSVSFDDSNHTQPSRLPRQQKTARSLGCIGPSSTEIATMEFAILKRNAGALDTPGGTVPVVPVWLSRLHRTVSANAAHIRLTKLTKQTGNVTTYLQRELCPKVLLCRHEIPKLEVQGGQIVVCSECNPGMVLHISYCWMVIHKYSNCLQAALLSKQPVKLAAVTDPPTAESTYYCIACLG
jgi:hypothetical protein